MAVSTGNTINATDFNGIVDTVWGVLGNGSGQTGYGQVSGVSKVTDSSTQEISHTEWTNLVADMNKCKQHQTNGNIGAVTPAATKIIGADATGDSVTITYDVNGDADTVSIDSANTSGGVNDIITEASSIVTNAASVHSDHYTVTTSRSFGQSETQQNWGGSGDLSQFLVYTFQVRFPGGYNVTNSSTGVTEVASGADHARHFFNAGGEIRLSGQVIGTSSKATDWAVMLQNMGNVRFLANSTECGSGRPANGSNDADGDGTIDNPVGKFQLNTSYKTIYQRNGGDEDSVYAENLVQIKAKRGSDYISANEIIEYIEFKVELFDNDEGDQRPTSDPGDGINDFTISPPGPGVDESVVGTTRFGVDLLRPTGSAVSVPEPLYSEIDDLDII
jgi:hypothetical protein